MKINILWEPQHDFIYWKWIAFYSVLNIHCLVTQKDDLYNMSMSAEYFPMAFLSLVKPYTFAAITVQWEKGTEIKNAWPGLIIVNTVRHILWPNIFMIIIISSIE